MSKMIILTRSPLITFSQVPEENVATLRDHKQITAAYGKQLVVEQLKYKDRSLAAVVVSLMGRSIEVSLGGTGCSYGLCFDKVDIQVEQPCVCNAGLFNRVR